MSTKRENILQLVRYIASEPEMGYDDPRYLGYSRCITDEMAEIAMCMEVRAHYTLSEMSALTKKSEEILEPLLKKMTEIGIIDFNMDNAKREKQYRLPLFIVGSGEYAVLNPDVLNEYPEVAKLFSHASLFPASQRAGIIPPGAAGIGMHVVPVEKAIEAESQSVPAEHLSHWLDGYEKYALIDCACRTAQTALGEGIDDDPKGWCVFLGDMAEFAVETNRGNYATREEVDEVMRLSEELGFVHQVVSHDGPERTEGICNCNVNTCFALRNSQLYNAPNLSRSSYVAHVDSESCVACGKCVEKCPAGAVKLGQKLCTKNGPMEYPKVELPDETEWGPDKWTPDYRDKNRVNTHATGTAPCKTACPANLSVQGYLKMAAEGKYDEALKLIKKDNPFPAICGSVCNRRCEDQCTRGDVDDPIAIDEVKKFLAHRELNAEHRYIPPVRRPSNVPFTQKIAIIGAGPAGMSCAFYLAELGYSPVVFDKNEQPGGMLRYGIPSFKLEKAVLDAEIDVLKQMGVEFKLGVEVGKDITLQQLRSAGYVGFYLAIGCQGGRLAGVSGEDADGVSTAVDFLKMVNADENHKVKGKTVVVGGGNVAVDAARCSVRCGADDVQMFCLESREEMPASDEEIHEAQEDGVSVNCGWGPKEVLTKNGAVSGIVFKKCVSVFDDEGRFAPQYDENETMTLECENIVMSIGQAIQWGNLLEYTNVKLGRGGTALADEVTYQTGQADIFVGGDVYSGPKFAIDAIAAGKDAALSLHRFARGNRFLATGRSRRDFIALDKEQAVIPEYDNSSRQVPGVDKTINQKRSFRDPREIFTEEQVKIETARCLSCGVTVVDENKCIGCGICTTRCAFDAITLHRDNPECSNMVTYEERMKVIGPYAQNRAAKIALKKSAQ